MWDTPQTTPTDGPPDARPAVPALRARRAHLPRLQRHVRLRAAALPGTVVQAA